MTTLPPRGAKLSALGEPKQSLLNRSYASVETPDIVDSARQGVAGLPRDARTLR